MGVLFTFPSQYSFAIGLTGVFSLAGWSRRIRAGFLVSRVTQDTATPRRTSRRGLSPAAAELSRTSRSSYAYDSAVLQPRRRIATPAVWALPRSLATTCGIIVIFSSYGYLDVSVPHVRPRVRVCRGRASTGCPIRTSPDLGVFATPRSFSQLITSFFAFESLGILHMPFFAFFYLFALRVSTLMSCLLVLFRLLPIRQ